MRRFLPFANSLDPDWTQQNFSYIQGANRLWGETTSSGNDKLGTPKAGISRDMSLNTV